MWILFTETGYRSSEFSRHKRLPNRKMRDWPKIAFHNPEKSVFCDRVTQCLDDAFILARDITVSSEHYLLKGAT